MERLRKLFERAIGDIYTLATYDSRCSLCKHYATCRKVDEDDTSEKDCWEWRYIDEWKKF